MLASNDILQEHVDEQDLLANLRLEPPAAIEAPCVACLRPASVVGQRVYIWAGTGDLIIDCMDRSPEVWWATAEGVSRVAPGASHFAEAGLLSTYRMAWNLSWHADREVLQAAKDLIDRYLLARPLDLDATLTRARIEILLSTTGNRGELPEHLASSQPQDAGALCALAELCAAFARGQRDRGLFGIALLWFDKALALDPAYVRALSQRGQLLLDLDAPAQAAPALARAYELLPEDHDIGRLWIIALHRSGRTDDAKAVLAQIAVTDPDHPDNADLTNWLAKPPTPGEASNEA